MYTMNDLIDLSAGVISEETVLDFACQTLAAVSQNYSAATPSGRRCLTIMRKAAYLLVQHKTNLQFAGIPLLDKKG